MDFQFRYEDDDEIQIKEKNVKSKQSVRRVKYESHQEKIYKAFNAFINELHNAEGLEEAFDVSFVEKALLKSLLIKFNNTEAARIAKISIRTLRNKKNLYGLKCSI